MDDIDKDKDGKISIEEYIADLQGTDSDDDDDDDDEDDEDDKEWIEEEKEEFVKTHDKNGNGFIDGDEVKEWLLPDEGSSPATEATHLVSEADIDGVSGDLFPEGKDKSETEPDWVGTEREQFTTYRDLNQDGYMDQEEVRKWIMPPDYDHVETEAGHLITESDTDGDGALTKEEILEKHELFAGSQATDFGEILQKHDEF